MLVLTREKIKRQTRKPGAPLENYSVAGSKTMQLYLLDTEGCVAAWYSGGNNVFTAIRQLKRKANMCLFCVLA